MSVSWPKKVDEHLGDIADEVDGDEAGGQPEEEPPIDEILRLEGIDPHLARIADRLERELDPLGTQKPPPPPPEPPPPLPNPPPSPGENVPSHQELAYLLARFRLDDATAKELGLGDTDPVQPPAGVTPWAFPRWHIDPSELALFESALGYPYRFNSSRTPPGYVPRAAPPLDGGLPQMSWPPPWELSPAELEKRGLAQLARSQARYYVAKGWVTPYVRRLSASDPVVVGVKAARAMLPKVAVGPKLPMKWCFNKGWMYTTPQGDPYLKWLYGQWALPWLDATEADAADVHAKMAAMATMFQEAHPSSINTYDGCVFSYGIGFAIGAPQIVCEIIKDPNVRKLLYLAGVHVVPRSIPGGGNIYDMQTVDLFDDASPNVQAWHYGHHWYGFMRPGDKARTMAPSGKGKAGNDPAFAETFKASTDDAEIAPMTGKSTDSTFADATLSSTENYYYAFQRLSNKEAKEIEVLSAFIAVAEDELTRAKVNQVNQVKITARATIPPAACTVYTEAGYTFVSMCVHNWAIPVNNPGAGAQGPRQIWLGQLIPPPGADGPFLRKEDADAVRKIRSIIGPRKSEPYGKITWANQKLDNLAAKKNKDDPLPSDGAALTDERLEKLIKGGPPADAQAWWQLAEAHDALVAKALARMVMSLLEWNRYLTGIKECAANIKAKRTPQAVSMWDEQVRSYNWGWRFKRLREYWLRMTNGHNYWQPLVSVVKGSGIDVNQAVDGGAKRWSKAGALVAPRGVRYTIFPDFDMSTPHPGPDGIMAKNAKSYPAIWGKEFGDDGKKIAQVYFDLGPISLFKVPALMYEYVRKFEIASAAVDEFGRPKAAVVRLLGGATTVNCDALGNQNKEGGPGVGGLEQHWPEAVPPPNWLYRHETE